jgi:hypothetical protein
MKQRFIWLSVLTISSASLCFGLIDAAMDVRGASPMVRPFHYCFTLATVLVVCLTFWTVYCSFAFLRRRGTFTLSIIFVTLLMVLWAWTLPFGDTLAIHYEHLDSHRDPGEMGYGWYYWDDSGMGGWPMHIVYITYARFRPWLLLMFFAFYPCFFYLHKKSSELSSVKES